MVNRSPDAVRLDVVEEKINELNRRTMELLKTDQYHDTRLINLESWRQAQAITEAREQERDIGTTQWRNNVETRFREMQMHTDRGFQKIEDASKEQRLIGRTLLMLVAGAVLSAFVAFIFKGGFAI